MTAYRVPCSRCHNFFSFFVQSRNSFDKLKEDVKGFCCASWPFCGEKYRTRRWVARLPKTRIYNNPEKPQSRRIRTRTYKNPGKPQSRRIPTNSRSPQMRGPSICCVLFANKTAKKSKNALDFLFQFIPQRHPLRTALGPEGNDGG